MTRDCVLAAAAFGLGALTMYLSDPQQGRRRRALEDLGNRAYGVAAEARGAVRDKLERVQEPAAAPESAHHLGR